MAAAPDDIAALKAALAAAERRADLAEAEVANRRAKASHAEALIAHLTLELESARHACAPGVATVGPAATRSA